MNFINIINNIDKIQNSQSSDIIDTITDLCNNGVSTNDIINQLKNIKIQENKRWISGNHLFSFGHMLSNHYK